MSDSPSNFDGYNITVSVDMPSFSIKMTLFPDKLSLKLTYLQRRLSWRSHAYRPREHWFLEKFPSDSAFSQHRLCMKVSSTLRNNWITDSRRSPPWIAVIINLVQMHECDWIPDTVLLFNQNKEIARSGNGWFSHDTKITHINYSNLFVGIEFRALSSRSE